MEYRNTCNSDNSRLSIGAQVHLTASYLNALKKSFFCSVDKVPKKCITILALVKQLHYCKEIKFTSEKIFQKISVTIFFCKYKIGLTSPTLWLKKDFALFRE